MKYALSVLLLIFGYAFSASAQADPIRCEGCDEFNFRQKAIQLGEGFHIITSLSTNEIKAYDVIYEREPWPGYPNGRWFAMPAQVPADISGIFVDAREFYVLSAGSMHYVVEVDGDALGVQGLTGATAFDVMTDINLKSRLGDRLIRDLPEGAGLERMGEQVVQGIFALIGASDASIEITVRLADDSIVVYVLSAATDTGEYQDGRSRTKGGQAIPESNSAGNTGTWYGTYENLSELSDYMREIGAKTSAQGSGTIVETITCTWDGRTLHCIVKYTRY